MGALLIAPHLYYKKLIKIKRYGCRAISLYGAFLLDEGKYLSDPLLIHGRDNRARSTAAETWTATKTPMSCRGAGTSTGIP
jgi:hypothetical protein